MPRTCDAIGGSVILLDGADAIEDGLVYFRAKFRFNHADDRCVGLVTQYKDEKVFNQSNNQ